MYSSGVARTQLKPGHSIGTLRLREFLHKMKKELGGAGGMLPRKDCNLWASQVSSEAILGHTVVLNQEHFSLYLQYGCMHGVKSLLYLWQTCVVRSEEHMRPRYSEDTDSYTAWISCASDPPLLWSVLGALEAAVRKASDEGYLKLGKVKAALALLFVIQKCMRVLQ